MNDNLAKVLVIGASLGMGRQLAELLQGQAPAEPSQPKPLTDVDTKRLLAAEAKRARRAARLSKESSHV